MLRKKAADLESKLAALDIEMSRHLDEKTMMELAIQKVVQETQQRHQEFVQRHQEAEQRHQEFVQRHQEAEQRHQEFVERHQLIKNELQARLKKKESDFDRVVQQLMELQRNRFGRKTERFVDDENPQVPLFPVDFDNSTPNPDSEDIEVVAYKRKKSGGRRPLDLSGLPHREEIVPVDDKDRLL